MDDSDLLLLDGNVYQSILSTGACVPADIGLLVWPIWCVQAHVVHQYQVLAVLSEQGGSTCS